jgi:hypothetical protein
VTQTPTYQQMRTAAIGQAQALFVQTMGYVAGTAARRSTPLTVGLPAAERDITMRAVQVVPDGRRLGRMLQLLAQGALTVSVGQRFPLEQAAVALAQTRHGAHGSGIVLWPADPG